MDEAFEAWFKELYIREGFVSSKVELYAAWRAAMLAEREACVNVCETIGVQDVQGCSSDYSMGRKMAAVVCANMIRAR